jgi:ADP-ribose pyrophosphatase YjhB (NUDIX family)
MNYCVHLHIKKNKVLLLKRAKNNSFFPLIWTPIIGKIKPNEAPHKAVCRETEEETKLVLEDDIYFFSLEEHKEDKYWFYFSINDADKTSITLNHENEDYKFFNTNKLPENLWELFNKQIHLLMNYLS